MNVYANAKERKNAPSEPTIYNIPTPRRARALAMICYVAHVSRSERTAPATHFCVSARSGVLGLLDLPRKSILLDLSQVLV